MSFRLARDVSGVELELVLGLWYNCASLSSCSGDGCDQLQAEGRSAEGWSPLEQQLHWQVAEGDCGSQGMGASDQGI